LPYIAIGHLQISLSSIGDWYIVLAAVVVLMVVAIAPVVVDSFSCCSCRRGARTRGGRASSGSGNHKYGCPRAAGLGSRVVVWNVE